MQKRKLLNVRRERRAYRVRKKTRGVEGRPRLTIHRSLRNLSCQIIDDQAGKTLVSASTAETGVRDQLGYGGNKQAAEAIGKLVAERALAQGITQVCFDRGHFKYHGRVAALADAARQAGLGL